MVSIWSVSFQKWKIKIGIITFGSKEGGRWQSGGPESFRCSCQQVVEGESSGNTIRLRFTKAGIPLAAKVMDLIEELQDEKAEKYILNESGEYVAFQAQELVGKRGVQELENFSNASLLGELHHPAASRSAADTMEKEFDPKGKQAPKSNQKEETIRLITQGLLKEGFLRLAQWRLPFSPAERSEALPCYPFSFLVR